MTIGDKVKFEDPFSDTLFGEIILIKRPRCKCKGMGHYIVDFGDDTKEIKIGDKRLSLYSMEPNKTSLGFKF
jgi:hypothetical protein